MPRMWTCRYGWTRVGVAGLAAAVVLAFGAGGVRADDAVARDDAPGVYVWWEGEDFDATNVPQPRAPYPGNITAGEREKLSGGTWVTPRGPGADEPYFLTYQVEVPETRTYNFWVRKFWKHGPFRWRFGDREWTVCGRDIALHDDTYLRLHIGANWVFLGQVELARGRHTLRVEMLDRKGGGAIDAFLLIDGPFMPRGKLKPGETTGRAKPGFFAWEPPIDPLLEVSPIDLRHLNEAEAGVNGFVRREGNGFVLGSGEPVRFWMVQGSGLLAMKKPMMDYWARRLAKYGVNLVRLGMLGMFNNWKEGNTEAFNERLDRLHYLVAALKREGIYVYLGHLYWHTSVSMAERHGFPGYGEGKRALALLFIDPNMQDFYIRWVHALLNTENPYTGVPLSQEPTVAFVEIQNESSVFFWTFRPQNIVPETLRQIERAFGDWAKQRYGSLEEAFEAWGPQKYPVTLDRRTGADHPEEGRLGLYGIHHLTQADWAVNQRNPKRASDQLRFMYQWQRGFYEKMIERMRGELGVRNMIACSNWKTAEPATLGVLERHSYLAGDVICRNVYFGVDHDPKPKRFHAVDEGDTYRGISALKPPAVPSPLTIGHVDDHPYMITENNWTRPNRFRSEWPFLVATYGSLQGVDGWNFFALDTPQWATQMDVWDINVPSIFGQFPAAALIYRQGYVREADTAVTDRLSLEDLFAFRRASLFELSGRDALWEERIGELEGAGDDAETRVDGLAYFVGKVNRVVTEQGDSTVRTADLSAHIDHEADVVTSLTGELRWDFGQGVVTADTAMAQGASGFLAGAGRIELGQVTVASSNEYATIWVVSLDGRPLAESRRILIQAGTEDWPYGFETEPVNGRQRITDLGDHPLNVRQIDASVTIANPSLTRAMVLNGNGYVTDRTAELQRADGRITVTLPADSLYTIVEADE